MTRHDWLICTDYTNWLQLTAEDGFWYLLRYLSFMFSDQFLSFFKKKVNKWLSAADMAAFKIGIMWKNSKWHLEIAFLIYCAVRMLHEQGHKAGKDSGAIVSLQFYTFHKCQSASALSWNLYCLLVNKQFELREKPKKQIQLRHFELKNDFTLAYASQTLSCSTNGVTLNRAALP